jgi:hypothetical protein
MMGDVSPETCWVSYKHGIINFDKLLHLVGYFSMNCQYVILSTIDFTWSGLRTKPGSP